MSGSWFGLVASESGSVGSVLDPPFGLFAFVLIRKHGGQRVFKVREGLRICANVFFLLADHKLFSSGTDLLTDRFGSPSSPVSSSSPLSSLPVVSKISTKAVGKLSPQDQIGSSILMLSFLNCPWPSHRALVSPRLLDVPFCTRQRDDSHTGNVALEQSSTAEGELGRLWTWMLNSRRRLPFYEEA